MRQDPRHGVTPIQGMHGPAREMRFASERAMAPRKATMPLGGAVSHRRRQSHALAMEEAAMESQGLLHHVDPTAGWGRCLRCSGTIPEGKTDQGTAGGGAPQRC